MTQHAEAIACTCAHLADERKAEDIVVLQVEGLTVLTDYFVIATGRNVRQINAITAEVRQTMHKLDHRIVGMEGEPEGGWVLMDLGEAILHLFTPVARKLYDLELLWGDAPRVDWQDAEPLHQSAPAAGTPGD